MSQTDTELPSDTVKWELLQTQLHTPTMVCAIKSVNITVIKALPFERQHHSLTTVLHPPVAQVTWDMLRDILPGPVCWLLRFAPLQRQSSVVAVVCVLFGVDVALFHAPPTLFGNEGANTSAVVWLGLYEDDWVTVSSPLAEVAFALIGIVLMIVSLILQLSATRYNPHVVALFFRDEPSRAIMHFLVGTALVCLWINVMLLQGHDNSIFIPRVSCTLLMLCISSSTLLVIPFFEYVFEFIDPRTQVNIIRASALLEAGRPPAARVCRDTLPNVSERVRSLVADTQHLEECVIILC